MITKYYYWLVKRMDGKPYLIYGGETEEEAQQRGLEMLGTTFEIKRLPTRDQGRASSFIKGNILENTRDLRQATRRISHKLRRRQYENDTGSY